MGSTGETPPSTHYFNEDYPTDHEHAPLCKQGVSGDSMSFFREDTTCPRCLEMLSSGEKQS